MLRYLFHNAALSTVGFVVFLLVYEKKNEKRRICWFLNNGIGLLSQPRLVRPDSVRRLAPLQRQRIPRRIIRTVYICDFTTRLISRPKAAKIAVAPAVRYAIEPNPQTGNRSR